MSHSCLCLNASPLVVLKPEYQGIVNTMADDAPAPCIAKSPADMLLPMQ